MNDFITMGDLIRFAILWSVVLVAMFIVLTLTAPWLRGPRGYTGVPGEAGKNDQDAVDPQTLPTLSVKHSYRLVLDREQWMLWHPAQLEANIHAEMRMLGIPPKANIWRDDTPTMNGGVVYLFEWWDFPEKSKDPEERKPNDRQA